MMIRIINILFIAIIITSCSSIPKDEILKDARLAYAEAKANPATANLEAMYDAKKAMKKAENAEDADEMKHLASMAKKRSEMALVVAKRKEAESTRDDLLKQKDQVVLQAREKEISAQVMDLKAKEQELANKQQLLTAKQAKIQKLQHELNELKTKQTERGLVVTLGDVLFKSGKANLLPTAQKNIFKVANFLNRYPERNVIIGGHTDNVGSDDYNLGLSQRRADAERFAIIERNVASNRIQSQGFGETQPVASNVSDNGRQQNRRVEITILNKGIALR